MTKKKNQPEVQKEPKAKVQSKEKVIKKLTPTTVDEIEEVSLPKIAPEPKLDYDPHLANTPFPPGKPSESISCDHHAPEPKTIACSHVFRWGTHVRIGKNGITSAVEHLGRVGSIGFILVYETPEQAKSIFPDYPVIEI